MSFTPEEISEEIRKALEAAYNGMEATERQKYSELASQANMPVLEFLHLIIQTGFEEDPHFLEKALSSVKQSKDFLERLVVMSIYHCENIQLT